MNITMTQDEYDNIKLKAFLLGVSAGCSFADGYYQKEHERIEEEHAKDLDVLATVIDSRDKMIAMMKAKD